METSDGINPDYLVLVLLFGGGGGYWSQSRLLVTERVPRYPVQVV